MTPAELKPLPILFSALMVRAILDDRKTQTRRLAWRRVLAAEGAYKGIAEERRPSPWQRVKAGRRLWVRETWQRCGECRAVNFLASAGDNCASCDAPLGKWRPSIHLAERDARIWLEATADARVEPLQAISEADAEAEGLWRGRARRHLWWLSAGHCRLVEPYRSHKDAFADLWAIARPPASRGGPDGWSANPDVAVNSFRRVQP